MLPINVYPRNLWYMAAFGADVSEVPLARTICSEPVALFRTATGRVVAVEDRCCHRGMPLSAGGECSGEIIRCPYHGLEFDASGVCVKIPGQDRIPPDARIISYPVLEKDALVWIWMGDPAAADPALAPSYPYHNDPAWAWSPMAFEVQCDWQMLIDNLLDLTHVVSVHRNTVGGDPDTHSHANIATERIGKSVLVKRTMPNSNPPPYYLTGYPFSGKIDRWQEIRFSPPLVCIWAGGIDAGTGALESGRVGGVQFRGLHAVTPKSATSCYYYHTIARNFLLTSVEAHEQVRKGTYATLLEDKVVLEAQQKRVLERPEQRLIDIRVDAGPLHARRVVEELAAAEAAYERP